MADKPPAGRAAAVLSAASYVLVSVAAAGLAVWVYGRTRPGATPAPSPTPSPPRRSAPSPAPTPAPSPPPAPPLPAPASETAAPRAPLQIVADPPQLRVWQNTRVALRAEAGPGREYVRWVWHFEDGSDPARGQTVTHVFPESVTDRQVTLEAYTAAGARLVVSRALPIEKLAVVPLDGGPVAIRPIPKPHGMRLLLVGGRLATARLWGVVRRAAPVSAIVIATGGPEAVPEPPRGEGGPEIPILALDTRTFEIDGPSPGAAPPPPALALLRGADAVKKLISGTAEVTVIGGLALVVHDTRWRATPETAIRRTLRAMEVAAAYPATALLSAKPLAALVDGDEVAPSAFRLYEGAVRNRVAVLVSASSAVAYDARYGALETVSIGRADTTAGCRRLSGDTECQSPSLTLVDIPAHGRVRTLHLRGPRFVTWLTAAELPASVGKYRR